MSQSNVVWFETRHPLLNGAMETGLIASKIKSLSLIGSKYVFINTNDGFGFYAYEPLEQVISKLKKAGFFNKSELNV